MGKCRSKSCRRCRSKYDRICSHFVVHFGCDWIEVNCQTGIYHANSTHPITIFWRRLMALPRMSGWCQLEQHVDFCSAMHREGNRLLAKEEIIGTWCAHPTDKMTSNTTTLSFCRPGQNRSALTEIGPRQRRHTQQLIRWRTLKSRNRCDKGLS